MFSKIGWRVQQNSQSEGSDFIGSKTAEAEEDTDPSNEAEDWSCCVTAEGVSIVGVPGVLLVTADIEQRHNTVNN